MKEICLQEIKNFVTLRCYCMQNKFNVKISVMKFTKLLNKCEKCFFILMITVMVWAGCNVPPSKNDAFLVSQQFVEEIVPEKFGELDFPFSDFRYDDIKNNEFIIESYFNCKAGKITYRVKLKYKGEGEKLDNRNWKLLNIEFPGQRF